MPINLGFAVATVCDIRSMWKRMTLVRKLQQRRPITY